MTSAADSYARPRMPSAPSFALPAGACDCHAHVFGPYERFPVVHVMHYQAPLAPAGLHREMLDLAGLHRGVLVQPGAYGTEPSALLDALRGSEGRVRGIGVADATISESALDEWHEAGVRGLRFNDMLVPGGSGRFAGSVGSEQLEALAPRLKSRGWHAEIWATAGQHASQLAVYRSSGIPVVLDHMAGASAERGVDDPAFRAILSVLGEGWLSIKLALCRSSGAFPDYADARPLHDVFVATRADRMIWGSDWPYLRLGDKTPDVGRMLDIFCAWVPDDDVRQQILSVNPAVLYDFG